MKFAIIGVPFNGDGTPPEVENPAQAIRDGGLLRLVMQKGHDVTDFGDLRIPSYTNERDSSTNVFNFSAWQEMSIDLSVILSKVIETDMFPLILGGDCSILMGIFDAYQAIEFPLNLFFLDGHADFHSIESSPTGEPADIELAALTGHLRDEIVHMTGRGPLLDEENVVVYGINEYDQIETTSIEIIDRNMIAKKGIESTFSSAIGSFNNPDYPIWFHFDVDVLDRSIMPAVHFPVENGLSLAEMLELLTLVVNTNRLIGISVTCYHPNNDLENQGIRVLFSLFENFF